MSVCVCQMQGICKSLFLVADIRFFMTLVMAVALASKALRILVNLKSFLF